MKEITPDIWMKSWDKHVKNDLDYPTKSLGILYARAMERYPDKPAFWMMKRKITYKEFLEDVKKFTTFLQQNGVEKGDVVAINLPNCPQYMTAHFGTILAGGVASGCSILLSESELAYQLNDSGAKIIITLDAIYDKRLRKILDEVPKLEVIVVTNISEFMGLSKIAVFLGKMVGKIPKGEVTEWPGKKIIEFLDILENTPIEVKEVKIDVDKDLALLQYTGGTTGYPKGTELTHSNLITQHKQLENWLNMEEVEDIILSAFPTFHLAGLIVATQATWLSASQILIPNPRDTDHIIAEMIDKKATILVNVPSLYGMLMNNPKSKSIPKKEVLDNVRVYLSGAAPFPAEMIRDFERHMQAENKVMEVYGMTETSPVCIANPFLGRKKVGKVGLPLQDTLVKIVNIETNEPVKTGEAGEILVKGPIVTRGYYNKPEETEKTIDSDGWLHTGDVGVMDEDGYVQIIDRIKDMLIVSGYKVYSVHVEDILTKHPSVEQVAIVGLNDPDRPGSEIVKAYVKLKGIEPTKEVQESIKKFAMENLSKYENPKVWEFRKELPLTAVGKVLKRALRQVE